MRTREERTQNKGGPQFLCHPPPTPTQMEGVEIEAEPPSREDPAPTAPAQGEQEEVGGPAGAEEDVARPRNGDE